MAFSLNLKLKLADLLPISARRRFTRFVGWLSPNRVEFCPQIYRGSGGGDLNERATDQPPTERPIAVTMVTLPCPVG